jgi:hypothetical protein
MGQQQLLLVILVTIIVGIATIVAINVFSTGADAANIDLVRQDVAQLASAAQGYYMKPNMLGGGGQTFNNISFKRFSFPYSGILDEDEPMTAWNENGKYVISVADGGRAINVLAHPRSRINGTIEDSNEPANASETLGARIEVNTMCWGDSNPPGSC